MSTSTIGTAVVVDGFLSAGLRDAVFDRLVDRRHQFTPARTRAGISEHRRAFVLANEELGPLASSVFDMLVDAIRADAGRVGIDAETLERIQLTITASGPGCYYRPHRDRSPHGVESYRTITAVVFLSREPRAFSGGDLVIHPLGGSSDPLVIEPVDNRLVLFDSRALHEVLPVDVPDDDFEHYRFSLVSWAG